MCSLVYPYAVKHFNEKTLTLVEIKAAIAATGEGYSFPTNLDSDPPTGGLAPETQQEFFMKALQNNMFEAEFENYLAEMDNKKTA